MSRVNAHMAQFEQSHAQRDHTHVLAHSDPLVTPISESLLTLVRLDILLA